MIVVGIAAWDTVPQELVMHSGFDGEPTWSAPKGFWSVFALPLISAGLALFIWMLAPFGKVNTGFGSGSPATESQKRKMQTLIGLTNIATSGLLAYLTYEQWFGEFASSAFLVLVTIYVVAILAGSLWVVRSK